MSVVNSAATDNILGYDELGRITGSSQTIGGGSAMLFSYTYNLADALVSTGYPSGRTVTNTYDPANRIIGVGGTLGTSSTTYVSGTCNVNGGSFYGICYASNGAPGTFSYGNGVARTYTYNNRQQPTGITDALSGTTLMSFTNTFGSSTASNNGNLTQTVIAGSGTPSGGYTQTFGYDPLNRLNSFGDTGGASQGFTFDPFGNFYQSAETGLSTTSVPALRWMPTLSSYINSAANRLTSANGTAYDNNGNDTAFLGATMNYDAENRQVGVANGMNSYTYAYDGMGERVSRTLNSSTTVYVHDAFGNLATEYNSPATAACTTCCLRWDHLGSTRMVTDGTSGAIVARHDYLPFGVEIPTGVAGRSSPWGVTDGLSPKFTGQDHDTESFLEFYQARYLAGGLGRFLSVDPGDAGADPTNPQSWNMYSYVVNNPLGNIDPDGLDTCYLDGIEVDCGEVGDDPSASSAEGYPWPIWGGGGYSGGGGGNGPNPGTVIPLGGTPSWPGNGYNCNQTLGGCNGPAPNPSSSSAFVDLIVSSLHGWLFDAKRKLFLPSVPLEDPYRLLSTRYCGKGGAGKPVNGLDAACQAHDECYNDAGLTADANTSGAKVSPQQVAEARRCNQALYDYARSHPNDPGSAAIEGWLIQGVYYRILLPNTAARPW